MFIWNGYVQVSLMLYSLKIIKLHTWIINFVSPLEAVPECPFQSAVLWALQSLLGPQHWRQHLAHSGCSRWACGIIESTQYSASDWKPDAIRGWHGGTWILCARWKNLLGRVEEYLVLIVPLIALCLNYFRWGSGWLYHLEQPIVLQNLRSMGSWWDRGVCWGKTGCCRLRQTDAPS